MSFTQPLSARAPHARKIYTSTALEHNVSVLFRIDYIMVCEVFMVMINP